MTISTVFLIAAFICFVLGAFSVPTGRVSTVSLGLAFWLAAVLITGNVLRLI